MDHRRGYIKEHTRTTRIDIIEGTYSVTHYADRRLMHYTRWQWYYSGEAHDVFLQVYGTLTCVQYMDDEYHSVGHTGIHNCQA
jgi:hypothetical protein